MEKPKNIPTVPGVYIYKDKGGRIIYIGKARQLNKRVLSYFRPPEQLTVKTRAMMSHACSIDFLTTGTEKEALLLEAGLIKKHRPHYNIVLRDDKQYILFRIDNKNPFPRLEIVRKVKKDRAKYFGPFTSSQAARETWKTIHGMFALRRCNDRAMKNRIRPCLYHHIGLCLAPCSGNVSPESYFELIKQVQLFLGGRSKELLDKIQKNMEIASENLNFERAAVLRDQCIAIKKTLEKQSVVLSSPIDMDVIGIAFRGDGLGLAILFIRGGALIDKASFFWANLAIEDAKELLFSFLTQFYRPEKDIPSRILIPYDLTALNNDDFTEHDSFVEKNPDENFFENQNALDSIANMLSEWRTNPVKINQPKNNEEFKLIGMAKQNAKEAQHKRADFGMDMRLSTLFQENNPIRKIECIDVSHTSGVATKIGMVVYQDGKPHKSEYRVWNVEDCQGDDHKALINFANFRIKHDSPYPDLMLIDGGRGQVNTVYKVFAEHFKNNEFNNPNLKENPLPFVLAGIAKARDEQGHADRRAGNLADRIFIPNRTNPLPFREGSGELLFLQSIRDTCHDFAINKHRKARAKQTLEAELLNLPNLGPHTAKLLWEHFKDLQSMKNAKPEDLEKLPRVGRKKAKMIHESLKQL